MKIFYCIVAISVCVALGILNFRQMILVEHDDQLSTELAENLNLLGRERYLAALALSQFEPRQARINSVQARHLEQFQHHELFQSGRMLNVSAKWDKAERYRFQHLRLRDMKAKFQQWDFSADSNVTEMELHLWQTQFVSLVDRLQELNIELSNYLGSDGNRQMAALVYANYIALLAVMLAFYALFATYQRQARKKTSAIKQSLEERNQILSRTEEVLRSQTEDLLLKSDIIQRRSCQCRTVNPG